MTAARLAQYVTSPATAQRAVAALLQQPLLVIDTETQARPAHRGVAGAALDPYLGQPRLIQAGTLQGDAFVFDLRSVPLQLLLPLSQLPWVGHNLHFDLKMLYAIGMPMPPECHCTMLQARAITGAARLYSMEELARLVLGEEISKTAQASDWSVLTLTPEQLRYAVNDVRITARLFTSLSAELQPLPQLRFYNLLRRVLPVIARQEVAGLPFDWERCAELRAYYSARAEAAEAELLHWHDRECPAAPPLNVNSPKQIAELLLELLPEAELQSWPKTDSGALCTDADALSLLSASGSELTPALEMLRVAKGSGKIASTLAGYMDARHPVTGRLHPRYLLAGAVSGRFSCTSPNWQNPARVEAIRALMRPAAGRVLVQCDLAGIELRVLALRAPEPALRAVLAANADIHKETAAAMAGCAVAAVSDEQRSRAKPVIFGSMYGQRPAGLVTYARKNYGVTYTLQEAARVQARLWQRYPGMLDWQERRRFEVSGTMQSATACGNVRHFAPGEFAANATLAHEISGSAAEVLLHALAALPELLPPGAELVHHVHDEVVIECPAAVAEAAQAALEQALCGGWLAVFPDAPDLLNGLAKAHAVPYWVKDTKKAPPLDAAPPEYRGAAPATPATAPAAPAAPALVQRIHIPERMTAERMAAALAQSAERPDYGAALFYIRERQRVQELKEGGQQWPWTEDAVLSSHPFCCNRREDDRLTKQLHLHHRQPHDGTRFDWLGVILGRLTNTAGRFQALTDAGAWPADTFNPALIAETLQQVLEPGTAAYRIPVVKQWMALAGSNEHAQSIPLGGLQLALQVEPQLRAAQTMQQAVDALRAVPGLGDFFASQVAIDLRWMRLGSQWPDRDSWAHAGPGAQLGLAMLHRKGPLKAVPQPWALSRMLELQRIVEAELGMRLILTDIQNAGGCELSKYMRGWSGGHMKRTYHAAKQQKPKRGKSKPKEQQQ